MAEINIERKKKPIWPWILLLVLVALIGWVVYEYMTDGEIAGHVENNRTTEMLVYTSIKEGKALLASA